MEYRVTTLERDTQKQFHATNKSLEKISSQLAEISSFIRETYTDQKLTEQKLHESHTNINRLDDELKELRDDNKKWFYGLAIAVVGVFLSEFMGLL